MDKYNFRSSKHLWAVLLTAGLLVPGFVQGAKGKKFHQKRSVCLLKRK